MVWAGLSSCRRRLKPRVVPLESKRDRIAATGIVSPPCPPPPCLRHHRQILCKTCCRGAFSRGSCSLAHAAVTTEAVVAPTAARPTGSSGCAFRHGVCNRGVYSLGAPSRGVYMCLTCRIQPWYLRLSLSVVTRAVTAATRESTVLTTPAVTRAVVTCAIVAQSTEVLSKFV